MATCVDDKETPMRRAHSRPGDVDGVQRMSEMAPEHGFPTLQLKQTPFRAFIGDPNAFRERFDVSRIMGLIVYGNDENRVRESLQFASTLGTPHVTWVPEWKTGGDPLVSRLLQLERLGADANALDVGFLGSQPRRDGNRHESRPSGALFGDRSGAGWSNVRYGAPCARR